MKYLIGGALCVLAFSSHAGLASNYRTAWFSGSCTSIYSPDDVVACNYALAPDATNSSCKTKAGATTTGFTGTPDKGDLVACVSNQNPPQWRGSCHGWGLWNCGASGKEYQEWYAFDQISFNVPNERDRYHDKAESCQPHYGHPIYPLTGVKRLSVALQTTPLELVYDTRRTIQISNPAPPYAPHAIPSFGALWESNFHRRLFIQDASKASVQASRGRGSWVSFVSYSPNVYTTDGDVSDRLVKTLSGWRYFDAAANAEEEYDMDGVLLSIAKADGSKFILAYSAGVVAGESPVAGLLISLTDEKGRSWRFNYEQVDGLAPRVYKVVHPDGLELLANYDGAGNLSTLTWPDAKTKRFLYEQSNLPWALTGIKDENNYRTVTYGYDDQGRATDTQAAGGADHFHASWDVTPGWVVSESYDRVANIIWRDHRWVVPQRTTVTLSNGQQTVLEAVDVLGMPRATTQTQAGGSGCDASASELAYDGRGNITTRLDFNHVRSCHAHASDRNVETYRIEGLAQADACPADLATYQVQADKPQRKVSTLWHPVWKLEAQRAEPKRITTTVYNGQKDPIKNDGLEVVCAPAAPMLPDGSKIAVMCRRYEQSTDDDTGNLGFTAPVKETRIWNYAYNQYGQVLNESDPRTGKLTTYEYWPGTVFTGERGHWQGDLKTVTNALNQATNYLEYNKRGQVLSTLLPNGSTEQREYHVRGWLIKVTLVPAGSGVGQATQYDYFDTGLLKKVTQPDGSFANYTWDAAHRLTDVVDSVNNKVHYELDNAGNRTAEQFTDPAGHLAKTIGRTFDALGRMSSSSGLQ